MLLGLEDGAGAEDRMPKAGPKGAAQEVPREEGRIMAAIPAFAPTPVALASTLPELTIRVRPPALMQRYRQELLETFLKTVEAERPQIARVELHARASNERGIRLYESMGFVLEGRLERRIRSAHGDLEADVIMAWFNPGFDSLRNQC